MYSKGILPGTKVNKDMVLPFDFKAPNIQTDFKSILNKSMENSERKEDVGFTGIKTEKKSEKKYSPIITDKDMEKDEETEKTEKTEVNTKLLEAIFNLIEFLDSSSLNTELGKKEKGQLEEVKQILTKLSDVKENSNGKLIIDQGIPSKLEALEKLLNDENTNLASSNQIKVVLHSLKEALTSIQNQVTVDPNIQQGHLKEKYNVKTDSPMVFDEVKSEDTSNKEQPLAVKGDKSNTKFNFERKKQDFESEAKGNDFKDLLLSQGKEKNISISNTPEEGINNDKFTFEGSKPITPLEFENKQSIPVQKQLFNSIMEQVDKGHIHVREQDSEMHLQLKPDNLGSLSLKIAIEKGIVVAKIIAESQVVKETLESNFNLLKDALNDKGFAIQELSVSIGQDSNFKKRQAFEQFKKLKGGRMIKEFDLNPSSLGTMEKQSIVSSSNVDFFA